MMKDIVYLRSESVTLASLATYIFLLYDYDINYLRQHPQQDATAAYIVNDTKDITVEHPPLPHVLVTLADGHCAATA